MIYKAFEIFLRNQPNKLTPRLTGFEVLKDATFIFKNWSVSSFFDKGFKWRFLLNYICIKFIIVN